MVIGKRTHDEAISAAEDSSGSNNNNNNSNNNNNENDSNMDIVVDQDDVLGSTEESMETSSTTTTTTTTTQAPAAPAAAPAAPAAAMLGDPTENEHHQQAQQESPNTAMIVMDCAQNAVDKYLSEYDGKARDRVVDTIVTLFSQRAEKSKDQLASDLNSAFSVCYSMMFSGVFPDNRLSTDATLRSNIVDSFWEELTEQKILPESAGRRIAALDFQIVQSERSHAFDVDAFIKQVRLTKETWEKQITTTIHQEPPLQMLLLYDAPYFCFIQSSGMGKTKIMYEAVQELNDPDKSEYGGYSWKCALVMPGPKLLRVQYKGVDANDKKVVFDYQIDFPEHSDKVSISDRTIACFRELDDLLQKITDPQPSPPDASSPTSLPPQENCTSVLLCFDESQAFLKEMKWKDGSAEKTERAYLFRVIRLWLRLKKHPVTVVAVFAGTSASIANFRFECDDAQIFLPMSVEASSREWTGKDHEMHPKGRQFFPVFTKTTTIGCLAKSTLSSDSSDGSYKRAIPYGRPLFAVLDEKGLLHDHVEESILGRMLQVPRTNSDGWKKNDVSWFSVLATRVQMGQTTYHIASQLVAKGYANLLGVSEKQVRITYMPDPVCARLAMGMMSDSFTLRSFQGTGGTFWAEKLSALFQRGLCIPEKGDAGEIFVALYFLLCGDSLRTNDSFAIQLDKWIGLLKNGGSSPCPADVVNRAPTSDSSMVVETEIESATARRSQRLLEAKEKDTTDTVTAPITLESGSEVSINFIQVCRNNLRSFDVDWVGFKNQTFLRYLFNSAVAFYVYPGCPLIDFVAPIKICRRNKDPFYVPLLVSIKAREYFCPADAVTACKEMRHKAQESKLGTALCLLVVFGSPCKSIDSEEEFVLCEDSIAQALVNMEIVGKVLRIPTDDKFNLSKQFRAMTSPGLETEELLASHSFIRAFDGDDEVLDAQRALRVVPSKEAKGMLDELKVQLKQKSEQM